LSEDGKSRKKIYLIVDLDFSTLGAFCRFLDILKNIMFATQFEIIAFASFLKIVPNKP
jgi:hypothetical protein